MSLIITKALRSAATSTLATFSAALCLTACSPEQANDTSEPSGNDGTQVATEQPSLPSRNAGVSDGVPTTPDSSSADASTLPDDWTLPDDSSSPDEGLSSDSGSVSGEHQPLDRQDWNDICVGGALCDADTGLPKFVPGGGLTIPGL